MTVDELMNLLCDFDPDEEVVVAASPTAAYRLLGVFSRNGRVYLDPSTNDKDKVGGLREP